jgi:signal transduction histidine kinase
MISRFQEGDLSVSDDGCGMAPETRARIFEPFFSTRSTRRRRAIGVSFALG